MKEKPFSYQLLPNIIATLLLATLGGSVFNQLQIPLPWLLGSMIVIAIAAISGQKVFLTRSMRQPMAAYLGVILGSQFTWLGLQQIILSPYSAIGLIIYTLIALLCACFVLTRFFSVSAKNAFYGAMPGGLNEMVMLAETQGADPRQVAVLQSLRIFIIVLIVPPILLAFTDQHMEKVTHWPDMQWPNLDLCILALLAYGGFNLAQLIKLPARILLGPLILSSLYAVSGLFPVLTPPEWTIIAAQIILGAFIGCRFKGYNWHQMMLRTKEAFAMITVMLLLLIPFLYLMQSIGDYSTIGLFLAYSPGGINEMGLIAAALKIEVVFVIIHHVLRIFIILLFSQLVYQHVYTKLFKV